MNPQPEPCQWCGIPKDVHMLRWDSYAKWHYWTPRWYLRKKRTKPSPPEPLPEPAAPPAPPPPVRKKRDRSRQVMPVAPCGLTYKNTCFNDDLADRLGHDLLGHRLRNVLARRTEISTWDELKAAMEDDETRWELMDLRGLGGAGYQRILDMIEIWRDEED